MELGYEALEEGNIVPSSLKGSRCGVFVATGPEEDWGRMLWGDMGWDGQCSFVIEHILIFDFFFRSIYEVLWDRRSEKHGLWTVELVRFLLVL